MRVEQQRFISHATLLQQHSGGLQRTTQQQQQRETNNEYMSSTQHTLLGAIDAGVHRRGPNFAASSGMHFARIAFLIAILLAITLSINNTPSTNSNDVASYSSSSSSFFGLTFVAAQGESLDCISHAVKPRLRATLCDEEEESLSSFFVDSYSCVLSLR